MSFARPPEGARTGALFIPMPDLVAIVALLLALPGLWVAPRLFFASWLCAWWFWVGVTLGLCANCWMHALTGGRWGRPLRLAASPLERALPWLLLLFLPMAAGMAHVFPWAGRPAAAWTQGIAEPSFIVAWFTPLAFWARIVLLAIAWCWIARPATLERKGRAAAALLVYTITGSVAAVDLVMSLVPGWYSTGHGLVNLAGGALGGAALATFAAAHWAPRRYPTPPARPAVERTPPVWRDLGNLLLMWVLLWAYAAFLEFLIIWAENLPREVAWYVPRLGSGWAFVGAALVALQFGLALLCLLFRAIKDDPRRLARLAAALLAGQLLNCAWLVLPSVDPHGLAGWWLVPLLAIAMGLPLMARVARHVVHEREAAVPQGAAPESVHA
jgi:hypothetical protein